MQTYETCILFMITFLTLCNWQELLREDTITIRKDHYEDDVLQTFS